MRSIDQIVADVTADFDDIPASYLEDLFNRPNGVNEQIRKLEGQLKVRAHAAAYEEEVDHMAEFQRLRPRKSLLNPFFEENMDY